MIVVEHGVEVMLQTADSLQADAPDPARHFDGDRTWLFVEVADLASVETALAGDEIVLQRRTTFYGAQETGYRETGGHFVTFAQFAR